MAYLALYRRFRPSGFDGLIGQEHVVQTLINQIKTDRIGHAYLFCGARGTGKTSAAKIFARAINCLSPVNGSPCGKCEVCKALADNSNLDILEMDAASNNKVENVREIREKIQYPPVSGRYKVYIIDEVHMLTTEAFNALLKTLEEPPKHAVFILATTEAHKLPSTILSRCMRFDFRLIPTAKIAELIGKIYKEVGKEYDDEALTAIARAGAGSVRDALSIADICVSYKESKLTYSDVLEILGATDTNKITSLVGDIFRGDTGGSLETVEKLCESGKSVGVLCKDIISRLREIIVCKTCKNGREILEIPEDANGEIVKAAGLADENRILRTIEIFSEAEGNMRYAASPKILLECAVVKSSRPETDYNLDALLGRISSLEKALKDGAMVSGEKPKPIFMGEIKSAEIKPEAVVTRAETKTKAEDNAPYYFDDGEPMPPPEEPSEIETGGYKSINEQKSPVTERKIPLKEVKSEEAKPAEQAVEQDLGENTANISAGKLWGTVIRKLRAEKQIVLWIACQEMTATLNGRTLIVRACDEAGYNAVTKQANLEILSKIVKSVGDYEVEIKKSSGEAENKSKFDEDVEKVKNVFGSEVVKVED